MTKEEKEFQIIGKYKKNKKDFMIKQVISAYSKQYAIEKLFSIIGSRHNVKRYNIEILEVEEK